MGGNKKNFLRHDSHRYEESKCVICGRISREISHTLKVCLSCIRNNPEQAVPIAIEAHKKIRKNFHLPPEPPHDSNGITCHVCANECRIGLGNTGYCGLRKNEKGRLIQPQKGVLYSYFDPLPTNCCASWFCPGSRETGYNLAVFPIRMHIQLHILPKLRA